MVFDALVANGDRHQDNWGITRHEKSGETWISPMYDNSACLGRDFSQTSIQKYLSSDMELLRHLFKGKSKIGLADKKSANHFSLIRYLYEKHPKRIEELIVRISTLTDRDIENVVSHLPDTVLDVDYKNVVASFIKFRKNILINIGENMKNKVNELLLVWKDPDTRQRFVVGTLRYSPDKNEYMFSYLNTDLDKAVMRGFQNYPAFPKLDKVYLNEDELFPGIQQRLPNRKRANYPQILMKYNLDGTSSEMEILAATRGRLGTDNFEFVPAIHFILEEPFHLTFDLAAARYYDFPEVATKLKEHESVTLEADQDNSYDRFAVKVMYDKNLCLGYVPKYYSSEISRVLESDYTAKIKKLDIKNENPDEWAKVTVEVVIN